MLLLHIGVPHTDAERDKLWRPIMITMKYTLAGAALATTMLVSACGSGGHPAVAGHAPAGHAPSGASAAQQTCLQVDAVLSDGPDPGADPLGYAQAQILPLEQIRGADPVLSTAISTLAGAYQTYYAAHGTGSTITSTLNTAINRINSLCPGAGATT
jgi:hypothetical protein